MVCAEFATHLLHPPLEGEGREQSERGGVKFAASKSPHPDRLASLRSAAAVDPPPPGAGKKRSKRQ